MGAKRINGIVPDDGSYLGSKKGEALRAKKLKEEFDRAWKNQKQLLKNSLVKLYRDRNSIAVRWHTMLDWDDSTLITPRRIKRALNALNRGKFPLTANAVNRAIQIAQEIDLKIKADSFSWQDYLQWLPKHLKPKVTPDEPITFKKAIESFIDDYWLSKDKNKYQDHKNLKTTYIRYYNKIPDWDVTPTKEILDKVAREYPKSVNRNKCCSALKKIAPYCGLPDYDPKEFRLRQNQIEIKAKAKKDLSEKEIEEWYNKFPDWKGNAANPSHWELWQWIYGMQATYGFRNHEVLNIYNLDCKYEDDKGKIYQPFTDPVENPRGIIYTRGKGIKRAAFLPQPRKWLEQFNLRKIPQKYWEFMNEIKDLSDYDKAKSKETKLNSYERFLKRNGFTFTAYNLRHAYNVKSHGLGIPVSLIAKNLGHTIHQNTTTYLESQGLKSCLDALETWEKRQENKADSNLSLESQIDLLRQENEQLKAIIQQLLESLKSE
ncbi:MAG: hypothetical protein AB4368_18875 [Xenococcaceae cyanobacterium]